MIYRQSERWKWWLFFAGLFIICISVFYTNRIAKEIAQEEHKRTEIWANAVLILNTASDTVDVSFPASIAIANKTIPTLVVDELGHIIAENNVGGDEAYQKKLVEKWKKTQTPIEVDIPNIGKQYVYHANSNILEALKYYPYIQLGLISIFLFAGYMAFNSAKQSEQNRVWVGMAKETAHQLGTPISGMNGWIDYLRESFSENEELMMIAEELEKDKERLTKVAERFSKIGANPELKLINLMDVLKTNYSYFQPRLPKKVKITMPETEKQEFPLMINVLLFDWVIENLIKNAIDALEKGEGQIDLDIYEDENYVHLDVADTGKGIPYSKFKTIFRPGYTTKQRGWGLGLSLTKRIVEEYHKGKIFVKSSTIQEGTTFRISLPKPKKTRQANLKST